MVHPGKLIRSLQLGLESQHPALFKPYTSTSALWKLEVGSKSDFEPCWIEWWGSPTVKLALTLTQQHMETLGCVTLLSFFACLFQFFLSTHMKDGNGKLKEALCLLTSLAGRLLINQRFSTISAHAFAQNISWSHSTHRSMLRGLGALGVYFAFVTHALFDPFFPLQVQLVFHRGTSIWACTKWLK